MPKTSKVHKNATTSRKAITSSQPKNPISEPVRDVFYCCRCGREFKKQQRNFPASQSTLFRGNGGYLPICNECIDGLYEHYRASLGGDKEAIKRLCLKFDIYWNNAVYDMTLNSNTSQSRIRQYISKTNLYRFIGKTFDDTLDEAANASEEDVADNEESTHDSEGVDERDRLLEEIDGDPIASRKVQVKQGVRPDRVITDETIAYWGTGFTPEMYAELEDRREYWVSQYPPDTTLDPGEDALLRQVCNLEIEINRSRADGKPIEKMVTALNTVLGSLNMKPSQKKDSEDLYIPFGVEIQKWEEEDPVIEPDDTFKDVDNFKTFLLWVVGSLCCTFGVNNKYSKAIKERFDKELFDYTVERPEFDDDEDIGEFGFVGGGNDG